MDLKSSRTIVLIIYSLLMLTRGLIGYSLKESSWISKSNYHNLYYLDEGITSVIVLIAERRNLTRVFMICSAAAHAYLVLAQGFHLFPSEIVTPKIGDLIVNTDGFLLLIGGLLLFWGKDKAL